MGAKLTLSEALELLFNDNFGLSDEELSDEHDGEDF